MYFHKSLYTSVVAQSPLMQIWLGLVLPRMEAFYWLAVASKVSTADNLRRRGMLADSISDTCSLSGKEGESINHLFFALKHGWRESYGIVFSGDVVFFGACRVRHVSC